MTDETVDEVKLALVSQRWENLTGYPFDASANELEQVLDANDPEWLDVTTKLKDHLETFKNDPSLIYQAIGSVCHCGFEGALPTKEQYCPVCRRELMFIEIVRDENERVALHFTPTSKMGQITRRVILKRFCPHGHENSGNEEHCTVCGTRLRPPSFEEGHR